MNWFTLFCMKSSSRQCPNQCGKMHRVHIKITENKIQKWLTIPWQFCPVCKLMLPDWLQYCCSHNNTKPVPFNSWGVSRWVRMVLTAKRSATVTVYHLSPTEIVYIPPTDSIFCHIHHIDWIDCHFLILLYAGLYGSIRKKDCIGVFHSGEFLRRWCL